MAARVSYLSGNVNASATRAGHLAPMKDYLPDHHYYQRDHDRQRHEHNLNAEPGNGHQPSLRRRLILGIIFGSVFFLVVSCLDLAVLDLTKIDRTQFNV